MPYPVEMQDSIKKGKQTRPEDSPVIHWIDTMMVGRHLVQPSVQLAERLAEIQAGKYEQALQDLKNTAESEIAKRYQKLQATKGASV